MELGHLRSELALFVYFACCRLLCLAASATLMLGGFDTEERAHRYPFAYMNVHHVVHTSNMMYDTTYMSVI